MKLFSDSYGPIFTAEDAESTGGVDRINRINRMSDLGSDSDGFCTLSARACHRPESAVCHNFFSAASVISAVLSVAFRVQNYTS